MASWLRRFLLNILRGTTYIGLLFSSMHSFAEEKSVPLQIESEQLIQPEITRRSVKLDKIDTEDFEATVFTGILSIEDFGVNTVIGTRLAYHLNEDIFIEGTLAQSTAAKSSAERIAPYTLPGDRDITYYDISLGYNLLPGESFLTRNTSFNSALYIVAGVGNTTFLGDDKLTINIGGGFRLLATDWLALHIDVRDHIFDMDVSLVGEEKTAHNLEVTLGFSAFF